MAYQVIARKWRPQIFGDLVGQTHVSQTLINSIKSERIPHALLFTGPRGTGKTSAARILAKSLRCPNAQDYIPCGTCSECEDIAQSRSIDVIEIDGASNNGVDAIRELRDTVGFMPSSGKFKVYIIDEVHMLSSSAFNALLKTLEEPPAHVVFIMATTEAQKIPNTVLSRCQRYDFRKISTRLVAEHILQICQGENVSIENEAAWALARQGEGSMRDSQSLLDQVISFADGKITLNKVTEVLGLTDRKLLARTIAALIDRDSQAVVNVVKNVFDAGYDPVIFTKDLLEEIRNLVLIKVAPSQSNQIVDLPNEEIENLKSLAQKLGEEDLHLLFDMALKGAHDLHRAQDTRVVLEMLLLRMSIAPRIQNLIGILGNTTTKVQPASTSSSAHSKPASPTQPLPTPLNSQMPAEVTEANHPNDSLSARWNDFVDRVRKVNGLIAAKLDQVHLLELAGLAATIGVPEKYKFLYPQVSDANFQKKLVNYLNTFWGPGHTVEIKMIDPQKSETLSPTKFQEKKAVEEKEQIAKQVEDHPLVRQAKSIFNTQIKSIREN